VKISFVWISMLVSVQLQLQVVMVTWGMQEKTIFELMACVQYPNGLMTMFSSGYSMPIEMTITLNNRQGTRIYVSAVLNKVEVTFGLVVICSRMAHLSNLTKTATFLALISLHLPSNLQKTGISCTPWQILIAYQSHWVYHGRNPKIFPSPTHPHSLASSGTFNFVLFPSVLARLPNISW